LTRHYDAGVTRRKNITAVDMVFFLGGSKGPRPDHRDTACSLVPKPEKKTWMISFLLFVS